MDYLKSFTIGTSGLITFQHFAPLALLQEKNEKKDNDDKKENPLIQFSIIASHKQLECQSDSCKPVYSTFVREWSYHHSRDNGS